MGYIFCFFFFCRVKFYGILLDKYIWLLFVFGFFVVGLVGVCVGVGVGVMVIGVVVIIGLGLWFFGFFMWLLGLWVVIFSKGLGGSCW